MAIVYQHKRIDTGDVFYIGIGKTNNRAYDKKHRSKFWKSYISKYKYEVEITHKDIIWEEACAIEKYLISFYGRRDLGLGTLVNQTDGGDGCSNISVEVRKNKSNKMKGKNKGIRSKEVRLNISEGCKGRKQSIETVNKRVDKLIGKKHTEERVVNRAKKSMKKVVDPVNGNIYESMGSLAKYLNVSNSTVTSLVKKGIYQYINN